jgi:uncharacterized protein YuzE
VRITYDPAADAVYIHLTGQPLTLGHTTIQAGTPPAIPGFIALDWKDDRLVSIEILDASARLHPDLLEEAEILSQNSGLLTERSRYASTARKTAVTSRYHHALRAGPAVPGFPLPAWRDPLKGEEFSDGRDAQEVRSRFPGGRGAAGAGDR